MTSTARKVSRKELAEALDMIRLTSSNHSLAVVAAPATVDHVKQRMSCTRSNSTWKTFTVAAPRRWHWGATKFAINAKAQAPSLASRSLALTAGHALLA
eukprot:scaffold267442_cov45-Prasinocladus_malaysianus.AAC.1